MSNQQKPKVEPCDICGRPTQSTLGQTGLVICDYCQKYVLTNFVSDAPLEPGPKPRPINRYPWGEGLGLFLDMINWGAVSVMVILILMAVWI